MQLKNLNTQDKKNFMEYVEFQYRSYLPEKVYESMVSSESLELATIQKHTAIFFKSLNQSKTNEDFLYKIHQELKIVSEYSHHYQDNLLQALENLSYKIPSMHNIVKSLNTQETLLKEREVIHHEKQNFKPISHYLNKWLQKTLSHHDWQKESERIIIHLQEHFGFKQIFIETHANWQEVHQWANGLYHAISGVMTEFDLSPKAASLNGQLSLSYSPHYLHRLNADGLLNDHDTLIIGAERDNKMKAVYLHEYTHAIDKIAGKKYYSQIKNSSTDNIFQKQQKKEQEGVFFLSHQVLEHLLSHHDSKNNDMHTASEVGNLFFDNMKNTMSYMFSQTHSDSFIEKQYKGIHNFKKDIIAEFLNLQKKSYDFENSSMAFNNFIHSLVDYSFDNTKIDELNEKFHLFTNTLSSSDKINIEQNTQENLDVLLNHCQKLIVKHNVHYFEGINNNFLLVSQSHVARSSFHSPEKKYYINPVEMFARHIESYYDNHYSPLYPQLHLDEKKYYQLLLKDMVEYSGIMENQNKMSPKI